MGRDLEPGHAALRAPSQSLIIRRNMYMLLLCMHAHVHAHAHDMYVM